jgi:hypothetical protein
MVMVGGWKTADKAANKAGWRGGNGGKSLADIIDVTSFPSYRLIVIAK